MSFLLDVLEHMDENLVGLQQAARLLRPGSFLMITVSAFPFRWEGQDIVNQHRRRYTKQALISLLERGDFRNFEIVTVTHYFFPSRDRFGRRVVSWAALIVCAVTLKRPVLEG